jgi:hypothetical protein
MNHRHLLRSLIVALILPSCAGGLSKTQKASLTSLAVPAGTVKEKAYSDPQATSMGGASTAGVVAGAGFGLIGGLVAGTAMAIKQEAFEGKHKNILGALKSNTPSDVGTMVSQSLKQQLSTDAFYGPRLKASGAAVASLTVNVTSVTLLRNGDDHSPGMFVEAKLVGADGKVWLTRGVMADGYGYNKEVGVTNAQAPLATYAAQPALLRSHYQQVAEGAARVLALRFKEAVKESN